MSAYHTYQTLKSDLDQLRTLDRQGLVDRSVTYVGRSPDGQWEIPVIKIGKNPNHRILFIGNDHAREWIAAEVPCLLAELLVKIPNDIPVDAYYDSYKHKVRRLVLEREIWIVPMVNPEGNTFSHLAGHESWRKNRRFLGYEAYTSRDGDTWERLYSRFGPSAASSDRGIENWEELWRLNRAELSALSGNFGTATAALPQGVQLQIPVYGVDLNRNYPFQWGRAVDRNSGRFTDFSPDQHDGAYPGSSPASEYEVQAVMQMVINANSERKPFQAAMSYHSRGGVVLYPWGYQINATSQSPVGEFALYLSHLINEVIDPAYDPEQLERNITNLRERDELEQWFDSSGRPYYFPINPGYMTFGGEGGSFFDWAYQVGSGIPIYTIELGLVREHGAFQEAPERIVPVFRENLPAALALIEYGSLIKRVSRFIRPEIRTQVTRQRTFSNTVYACYFFPWASSSDFSVAWMKNGQFVRQVAWGDEVELALVAKHPERIQQDLPVRFEVFESDLFRFSDDFLKRFTTTLPRNTLQTAVKWRVGETDQGVSISDAYSDTGKVEFQFRAEIQGDVLRSEEVELIQETRLFWEVPTPFTGTFTLIARLRGMPVHLEFSGKLIVSAAYGPDYDDYKVVRQFPFDSQRSQENTSLSRSMDTIEVRQVMRTSDLRLTSESEPDLREYPFRVSDSDSPRIERVQLNLQNEPRYSFAVEVHIGGETFEARQSNLLVRVFEDLFIETDGRPNLNHHPRQDAPHEAAYRQRMVLIPDEVVQKLRAEVSAANEGRPNYGWWRTSIISRNPLQAEQITLNRTVKSLPQTRQSLENFVAMAGTNAEIRDFINQAFNQEEVNQLLSGARSTGGISLAFYSSSREDTGVVLKIRGRFSEQQVEELLTLNGANQVQTRQRYWNIASIESQGGTLKGIIYAQVEGFDAAPVNVNERKIRYDNLRELNDFLKNGGGPLAVDSTEAEDRSPLRKIIVSGYSDELLSNQVTEEIQIGTIGQVRFFKISRVYFDGDFRGVISLRAARSNHSKTLWRNIFDEDLPERIVSDYRSLGRSVLVAIGRWTQYLQKLANIVRDYLGLHKEIWIFLHDTTGLRPAALLAETTNQQDYFLITVLVNHTDFFDPMTITFIAHECKHAHQYDRVAKLPGEAPPAALNSLQTGTDTFDLRLVKAWQLNGGGGYISGTDSVNYPLQIRELDSEAFKNQIFRDLIRE